MEQYTDFAAVYDTFMDETPYDVWGDFVAGIIEKYGVSKPAIAQENKADAEDAARQDAEIPEDSEEALEQERNLVVELGCGTGSFTLEMTKRGYDIIGTDLSFEMLDIARSKALEAGRDIMFLQQDMRELDLYCTAGTIVSVCDSINYLTEDEDVLETFRLVNNFLYPKGLFIFDFNTVHKYRDVIGDATIAENREDCSFIWDNYYNDEDHINEYDLTIFARCDDEDEIFRRSVETHYQRGYELSEMKEFVKKAGLEFIEAVDADTHEAPNDDSERIYVIARECGK
ncbi:MAG: class I SAM-dependent methyltransferase [Butyrivibrio sp.]|nr:class I SAM-dependent methyltransferase [Butyrivibrio sp.]